MWVEIMSRYILKKRYTAPSKGDFPLPDIIYEYISDTSLPPYHYEFTRYKDCAYVFDDDDTKSAKMIASAWGMKLEQIN